MENKKIKILIIDDDRDIREMYAEVFQHSNFEVLEAVDGLQGLDIAIQEMPDVIFTGIVMPRMDGFSMMESLQKTVVTAVIPVVISSHMGREEDRLKAEALGARDFIISGTTRPIDVVARINALFLTTGETYKLEFNPNGLDAQKIAQDLNLPASFLCLNCNEKMVLNMTLANPKEHTFEAKFVCSKCGADAR